MIVKIGGLIQRIRKVYGQVKPQRSNIGVWALIGGGIFYLLLFTVPIFAVIAVSVLAIFMAGGIIVAVMNVISPELKQK